MSSEIAFRLDNFSKEYLKSKSKSLNISLSELVRIILTNNKLFNYDSNKIMSLKNKDNSNQNFEARLYVQINEQLLSKINNITMNTKLSISEVMRIMINLDNTELADKEYMDNCGLKLRSIGLQLNQIAHQLNADSLRKVIGYTSYTVVTSRLQNTLSLMNGLILLIKNYPVEELDDVVILINKVDKWNWLFNIAAIINNLNQINKRLELDYMNRLITNAQFNKVFLEIEKVNLTIANIQIFGE